MARPGLSPGADVLDTYELALDRLHVQVDEYERRLTQWTETDVTKELYAIRRPRSLPPPVPPPAG